MIKKLQLHKDCKRSGKIRAFTLTAIKLLEVAKWLLLVACTVTEGGSQEHRCLHFNCVCDFTPMTTDFQRPQTAISVNARLQLKSINFGNHICVYRIVGAEYEDAEWVEALRDYDTGQQGSDMTGGQKGAKGAQAIRWQSSYREDPSPSDGLRHHSKAPLLTLHPFEWYEIHLAMSVVFGFMI